MLHQTIRKYFFQENMPVSKQIKIIGLITFILCAVSFALPFIFSSDADSLLSILSFSFSAIGSITTAATLVVALLLYDRFGVESKFVEKQVDSVIELIDFLKGKTFTVSCDAYNLILRPSIQQLNHTQKSKQYVAVADKNILIHLVNYNEFINIVSQLRRNYWMPEKIKNKLSLFEFAGFCKTNGRQSDFVYLNFNAKHIATVQPDEQTRAEWVVVIPHLTLSDFADNLTSLIHEIETWLSQYSSIKLNFKLEEPI